MREIVPKGAKELVTPSETEAKRLTRVVEKISARTRSVSARLTEVTGMVLGGSFAKGTWLPGEADIDIFVKVSPEVDDARFEEVGLKIGLEATKGYPRGKKYAQHPYTEARVDGVIVNIVPCYDVQPRQWKSAADRSPYHVELIRTGLSDGQKLDVRLLKKFMKGVGVYGAEIEKEGFSGYVAEVLLLKHGSFENVLKHFAHLKSNGSDKLLNLPDPVDEGRDLAKAISNENIARFVLAARAYLGAPNHQFFQGRVGKKRPALVESLVGITFSHRELSEDILWGELKRTMRHLSKHIASAGFGLVRTGIASDNKTKSAFLLLPEVGELPPLERRKGPSVVMEKEAREFVTKNRSRAKLIWVGEDGRLHLLQKREEVSLTTFLKKLVGGEVKGVGGSPEISKAIAKTGRIIEGWSLQKASRGMGWLTSGIDEIVTDALGTSSD